MLKIAICDDDRNDINNLLLLLGSIETKYKKKFEIHSFASGEILVDNLKENNYDLILLDIFMDKMDGVEAAKHIQDLDPNSLIIFISSCDDRLRDLFGTNVISFVDKPVEKTKFEKATIKAINIIHKDRLEAFNYTVGGCSYSISINEIIFFESKRNYILIHTKKKTIEYRDSLSKLWTKVCDLENFIHPNRSFICNLNNIKIKRNNIVTDSEKDICTIGRIYKDETFNRYINYFDKKEKYYGTDI